MHEFVMTADSGSRWSTMWRIIPRPSSATASARTAWKSCTPPSERKISV